MKESENKKTILSGLAITMLCAACMLVIPQNLTAQSIEYKGVKCTMCDVYEVPGGSYSQIVRITFKYTMDENATKADWAAIINKGKFVVGKKRYKPTSIVTDTDEGKEEKRSGEFSLLTSISPRAKLKKIKYVFEDQEIPLESVQK